MRYEVVSYDPCGRRSVHDRTDDYEEAKVVLKILRDFILRKGWDRDTAIESPQ